MNEWEDIDNADFIWQQQLEEQQRREMEIKTGGLFDWDIMESIFVTPHKYEVRHKVSE